MNKEKKTIILELAKECPSSISQIVEQFFNVSPTFYNLDDLREKLDKGFTQYTMYKSIIDDTVPLLKLYLLVTNTNINVILQVTNETLLTCAVNYNRKSIVAFLLELGADLDACDGLGNTPLRCALASGKTEIAQTFLFKKYNVILSSPMEIIKFLLDKPREYYSYTCYGGFSMLLHYASRINEEAFKLALSVSSVNDLYGILPFYRNSLINLIVKWGHKRILKAAVDHGVDLNFSGDPGAEPLYNAVVYEPKMIPFLVKNGADLYSNRTLLNRTLLSDRRYHRRLVDIYGKLGEQKHAKKVKIFERCGINVNKKISSDENELFHLCRHATHVKPFLLSLERGTDISHVNRRNWTPLKFVLEYYRMQGYVQNKELPSEFLVSILTKMEENKDFVSQGNIKCLSDERVRYFHDRCKKEIDLLKKMKITQSICCYDFLTSDLQKLTTLARNKELMRQFRLQKLNSLKDYIYGEHLKRNYERSIWRLKEVEKTFKVTEGLILPMPIFEKICGLLNDKELRMSKYYFTFLKQFLSKN